MAWFVIQGYEGLYDISDSLQVRNSKSLRIMPCNSGRVTLCKSGISSRLIPRNLIATLEVRDTTPFDRRADNPVTAKIVNNYGKANQTLLAEAGKALVCFRLLSRGLRSTANDTTNGAWDVMTVVDGKELTISVRTTSGPYRDGRIKSYRFGKCVGGLCDLIAYVAVDSKCVSLERFRPSQDTRTFDCLGFIADAESSIDRVLTQVTEKVSFPDWLTYTQGEEA